MLTYAQKKYLFAIYRLGQNGSVVSSSDVSRLVGVSKASTVKMTQRLSDDGYILHKKVGIDEAEADRDAVKIVAELSEDSLEKLVGYALGDAANA